MLNLLFAANQSDKKNSFENKINRINAALDDDGYGVKRKSKSNMNFLAVTFLVYNILLFYK